MFGHLLFLGQYIRCIQTFVDDDFAGQTWVSNFCNFESFIKTDWGGMIFFSGNTGQPIPEASWSQPLKVYKDII